MPFFEPVWYNRVLVNWPRAHSGVLQLTEASYLGPDSPRTSPRNETVKQCRCQMTMANYCLGRWPRLLTPISAARWRMPSSNVGLNYLRIFSTSVKNVSKCYLNVLLETVIDVLFYLMVNQWMANMLLLCETKQQETVLWWLSCCRHISRRHADLCTCF